LSGASGLALRAPGVVCGRPALARLTGILTPTIRPPALRRAAVAAGLVAATACAPAPDSAAWGADPTAGATAQPPGDSAAGPATYEDFGLALLARLTAAAPGRNAFVSPTSAGVALSIDVPCFAL
jgi:hypothetical protein